jgi:2-dehydropantoate 2-reductase
MRIAIMGAGGVGGYFGGLLARAGYAVTFIARGEHGTAIQAHGLRVESVHGDFTVYPAQVSADPAAVGPVDCVIFAAKTHHFAQALEAMRPLIGPDTTILPLQNGIDAAERIAAVLGRQHVIGGLCQVGSYIAAPGVIKQISQFRRVVAGELDGQITPRVRAIIAALQAAGAAAEATPDIRKALWTKFIFIAPFSGVGAVARAPIGEIMTCPETRQLLEDAMREIEAVAHARGIALEADIVAKTMAFCAAMEPQQTASMQRDVMSGKPSELESMIGVMVRFGAELDVATPIFRFFYSALLPQERRARGAI